MVIKRPRKKIRSDYLCIAEQITIRYSIEYCLKLLVKTKWCLHRWNVLSVVQISVQLSYQYFEKTGWGLKLGQKYKRVFSFIVSPFICYTAVNFNDKIKHTTTREKHQWNNFEPLNKRANCLCFDLLKDSGYFTIGKRFNVCIICDLNGTAFNIPKRNQWPAIPFFLSFMFWKDVILW